MPKVRKRKVKPKVRTVKGVSQVVKININQAKSVRRRSYLKPNPTQGHNLVPQLISTRQEPFDLRLLGNLQERVNKLDNLSTGLYDRDFALEMQNQDSIKKREKEDIGIRQDKSVTPASSKPKRGRPFKTPIQQAIPFEDLTDLNATRQLDEALGITAIPELKPRGRSRLKKTKKTIPEDEDDD